MSEKKEWKLRRSTSKQRRAVQRLAGEIRLQGVVQDAWRREPEREKGRKLAPDPKTLPPPPPLSRNLGFIYSAGPQHLLSLLKAVGKSYSHPREGSDSSEENTLGLGRRQRPSSLTSPG